VDQHPYFYDNIAAAFHNQGENSITGVWRMILSEPVYEIFGFCNKTGLVLRK
jgi:hypothetical protein